MCILFYVVKERIMLLDILCKNDFINLYLSKIDSLLSKYITLTDLSVLTDSLTIHSCSFHKLYTLTFDTGIYVILA